MKTPAQMKSACPEHCIISLCSLHALYVSAITWGTERTDKPRFVFALHRLFFYSEKSVICVRLVNICCGNRTEWKSVTISTAAIRKNKQSSPTTPRRQTEIWMIISTPSACKRRGQPSPEESQGEMEVQVNSTADLTVLSTWHSLGTCYHGWSPLAH